VLLRACEAQSRDPATIAKTWLGTAIVTDSEQELQASLERLGRELRIPPAAARAFALAGTSQQVAEQARRYRDSGVDGIVVSLHDASDLEHLERVGSTLAEAMRG
jgi:alkanesulfonate monooxygenase SsuD/methylene tetrahydromethanopterin reductase-like flavin-dependent oxidoreductase (luciferase family)